MDKKQTNIKSIIETVAQYVNDQQTFKQLESNFKEAKAAFYNRMHEYFDETVDGTSTTIEGDDLDGRRYKVNRIQHVSVLFDPDSLKEALGPRRAKRAISKRYEINDLERLVQYLKSVGADPKVFKTFVDVHEEALPSELDRMENEGLVSSSELEGTYVVKKSTPYFTVTELTPRSGDGWTAK